MLAVVDSVKVVQEVGELVGLLNIDNVAVNDSVPDTEIVGETDTLVVVDRERVVQDDWE
jgi:hypothetical protein